MNIFLRNKPKKKDVIFIAAVFIACIALWAIPSATGPVEKNSCVFAKVISVDDSMITQHGLIKYGTQNLEVLATSGSHTGKRFSVSNELRGQLEFDKLFVPGDRITVSMPKNAVPGKTVLLAKDYNRVLWTFVLIGMFCLLLIIFGSWTGIKALISFVFSCLVIFKMVIPLTLRGWNASLVIFIAVVILTLVILILVAGMNRKALAACSGAIAGVFGGLLMSHIFSKLLNINGASMPFVQTLLYNGHETLDMADIFIGALILGCSGAIMDLAMDIASAVEEISMHNPDLGAKELTASGFRIGRSVTGTMTTTLLLAYSGGFLTLLMMFFTQGTSIIDIINNPLVAAEMVKTLIGSFSLVLVAPLTAFASGIIFASRK